MNDRAVEDAPCGIGGWLLAFVVLQCGLIPTMEAARAYLLIANGEAHGLLMVEASEAWLTAGLGTLVLVEIAGAAFMTLRLIRRYNPHSVSLAIGVVWASAILFDVAHPAIWGIVGDLPTIEVLDLIVFFVKAEPLRFLFALGWAMGWTAYFNRSKRVEHTYYYGEEDFGIEHIFS